MHTLLNLVYLVQQISMHDGIVAYFHHKKWPHENICLHLQLASQVNSFSADLVTCMLRDVATS